VIPTRPRVLSLLVGDDTENISQSKKDRKAILRSAKADRVDEFVDLEFLPANEACRDDSRIALDEAILIDLLDLPSKVMEPLDVLRRQWCAEPTVHGGKGRVLAEAGRFRVSFCEVVDGR